MVPQWNADIISPDEDGAGTKVIGDNQEVQTTLESGSNITIEDGKISASGTLENVQADWTQANSEDPSYIKHKPNLATVATSGDYGDLSNRPDLSVYATTSEVADKADKVTGAVSGNLAGFDSSGNFADSGVAAANLVHDASYVHTDNNFSNADVTKLSGIEAGAEVNVQSSWTETDTSSDAYIVGKPDLSIYAQSANLATVATSGSYDDLTNKPTIPAAVTVDQTYNASSTNPQSGTAVAGAIANKQDTISDLATIRTGAGLGATAVQPSDLATVATTGAYSDLSGVPTIPSGDELVPSASSSDAGKVLTVDNNGDPSWVTPSAGTVYTAGDGVDITNNVISADVDGTTIGIDSTTKKIKLLSTIPTVDQNYNASSTNAQSGTAVASAISTKQDTIADLATIRSGASAGATAVQPGDLATVATTGAYSDLSGTPTIPVVDQVYSASSANAQSGVAVASAISTKQDVINDLATIRTGAGLGATAVQPGDLATVATSGSYNDLSDKPTIPAAVTVDQTYSASSTNAQSGVAVAGAIAGKQDTISDLATIRSGAEAGATAVQPGDLATVATTGSYSDLSNTPTIPTVDQTYNAASANAQSGVAVAGAIAAINFDEVPAVTSSDDGKILKATYSGGAGSYAWATEQGTTYTAGDGVDITNNEISVKAGTGLEIGSATVQRVHNLTCSESVYDSYQGAYLCNDICQLTPDLISRIKATGGLTITLEKTYSSGGTPWWCLALYSPSSNNHFNVQNRYVLRRSNAGHIGPVLTFDNSDYDSTRSNVSLETIEANYEDYRLGIIYDIGGGDYWTCFAQLSGSEPEVVATYADSTTVQDCVNVSNPLPSSAQADAGKVLTVDASGNANWAANPLPASSSADTGKVLMVGSTGEAAWFDISMDEVPDVTSSDDAKVLTATYSGGTGSYAWAAAQGGTVDQTYNASSTNAQSGTAVAGALAAVPTKPLVAGSNITITENTNNVSIATTVDQTYSAVSTNAQSGVAVASAIASISVDEVPAVTSSDDAKVLTATYSGGVGSYAWAAAPSVPTIGTVTL